MPHSFSNSKDRSSGASLCLRLAQSVTGETPRDVNCIIPRFVLRGLPLGLAGVFIAAVVAAIGAAEEGTR